MRLDVTVTSDLQQLIQAAAAISGRSVDDFVVDAVAATLRRVLAGETVSVLNDRDRDRFLDLLDQPVEPKAALRAAAERCWPQSGLTVGLNRWRRITTGKISTAGKSRSTISCGNMRGSVNVDIWAAPSLQLSPGNPRSTGSIR